MSRFDDLQYSVVDSDSKTSPSALTGHADEDFLHPVLANRWHIINDHDVMVRI